MWSNGGYGSDQAALQHLLAQRPGWRRRLGEDATDIILGRQCLGCQVPGRPLCGVCRKEAVRLHRHDAGHWVAGRYEGHLRRAILAYKEHGCLALGDALGGMLAAAVLSSLQASTFEVGCRPIRLVPVPTHHRSRRDRGYDTVARLARITAAALRSIGQPASVAPALALVRDYERHSAVSVGGRTAVRGAFRWVPQGAGDGRLVIVDDVITTGETIAEACRALGEAGILPIGAAAVAGTVLRATRPGWPAKGVPGRRGSAVTAGG